MGGNAIIGTGILLKAGDGQNPENFTTVAEILSVKLPSLSRNEIDTSTHNDGEESKILGMLRKGQLTGMLNWLPTDATQNKTTGLLYDILNNVKRNWRVTLPPNGLPRWTMPARLQLFEPQEVTTDAPLQIGFAFTVAGPITIEEE